MDSSFGTNGSVFTPITTGNDSATVGQVIIDAAGRIVVVGGDGDDFVVSRYTSSGALDTSFGTTGVVDTPIPGSSATAKADRVALDATGALIVGGDGFSLDRGFFAPIFRYEPNGELDPTFGENSSGMAFANLTGVDFTGTITSLIVDHQGNILVGGNSGQLSTNDWYIMRFTANGHPDPTWGGTGAVDTSIGAKGQETAYSLAEQPDGKIVAVGNASIFAAGGYDIARYNANGTLDQTFGTGGIVNQLFPGGVHANALDVAVMNNGDLLVGGASTNEQWTLARFTSNGTLDSTFGTAGTVVTTDANVSAAFGFNVSMALDSSGRILLAGPNFNVGRFTDDTTQAPSPGNSSPAFPVLNPGQADFTLGWAGFVQSFPGSGGVDASNSVAVQTDGKVVQVGNVTDANGKSAFGVVRYTIDGRLDPTFGTGGAADVPITSGSFIDCESVAIQADGKIVIVGGDGTNVVAVRYLTNGTLDSTFGTGGVATVAVPAALSFGGSWGGQVVRIDSQGRLIVAGKGFSVANGTGFFGFVTRLSSTAAFDATYGGNGYTLLQFPGQKKITDVKAMILETVGANNQSVLVAGGISTSSWIVGRLNSAGVIQNLGTLGYSSSTFSGNNETAYGLAEQPDGKFLALGYGDSGTTFDVARYTATGTPDGTFGSGGQESIPIPGASSAFARGIAVEPSGQIVASGTISTSSNGNAVALAQFNPNGSLDAAFGTSGIAIGTTGSFFDASASGMALAPDGKIIISARGQMVPGGGIFDFNVSRYNEDNNTGLVIAPASQIVAPAGNTMTFTVTLKQAATHTVTVAYQTEDNSALAGTDYTTKSGSLTFPAGVTTQTVSVPIAGSSTPGPDKEFFVYLSNASGANLTVGQAVGRIVNQNTTGGSGSSGWTNPNNPLDVNNNGTVTPIDALDVLNYLNTNGSGPLPTAPQGVHFYVDTNANGSVSPIDALLVLNALNAGAAGARALPPVALAAANSTQGNLAADVGFALASGASVASPADVSASVPAVNVATSPSDYSSAGQGGISPAASSVVFSRFDNLETGSTSELDELLDLLT